MIMKPKLGVKLHSASAALAGLLIALPVSQVLADEAQAQAEGDVQEGVQEVVLVLGTRRTDRSMLRIPRPSPTYSTPS